MNNNSISIHRPLNIERNSSFELIRLIAQFFIVFYHLFLFFVFPVTEKPLHRAIWLPLHIGVILFILISGYFGIKASIKGFIKLIGMMAVLYIPLQLAYILIVGGDKRDIFRLVFFVSGTPFWFMRTYIFLYLFAPIINLYLKQSTLIKRIYLLVILGYISLYVGNLGVDTQLMQGKNLPTFLFLYVIGDTINLYRPIWRKIPAKVYGLLFISWNTGLVILFSIWTSSIGTLIFYRLFFSYCSVGLLISSILFFLWIGSLSIQSKFINFIAKASLAIYMIHAQNLVFFQVLGPSVSKILETARNEFELFGLVFILTLLIVCACILIYIMLIPVWKYIEHIGSLIQISIFNRFNTKSIVH